MAYSRVGAGGIWQFMPKTARSYGLRINWWIDERRSPQLATPYAIKHLEHLYRLFDNWYTALAAYNAGEGRISRAMKKVDIYDYFELIKTDALPRETRKYVPQYLAIVKIMKNMEALGFTPINWNLTKESTRIKIPGGTDLYALSKSVGLTWKEFSSLNPAFRRKVSDPSAQSTLIIPNRIKEKTLTYLKSAKPITDDGYTYYTVKEGDSWWFLSQLTKTPINSLKRLNNLSNNQLHIGQSLLLPGKKSTMTKAVNIKSSNGNLQTYVIKNGDTVSSLSIKYNIKLSALYRENNLNSYSILKVGQVVRLPGYPIKSSSKVTQVTYKEQSTTHKVRYGDTLSGISYKYDVSIRSLMRINNISNAANIKVGDVLQISTNSIKSENTYTVKSGDSIWIIAQKTQIPYKKLLTLNNLTNKSRLNIGDRIRLY